MTKRPQLKLMAALELPTLNTIAAPTGAAAVKEIYRIGRLHEFVDLLEQAHFDAVFETDAVFFDRESLRSQWRGQLHMDPIVILSALAALTHRIGLVATVTTSFSLPYQVARQLQVLDQISGGRAGWNAVTSFAGERQFGLADLPDQTERYGRASDYARIVQGLTSGWADDAVTTEAGRVTIHPERISEIAVEGRYLSAAGALGVPRSPQGAPVLFQAGGSSLGGDFAGQYAEAVFSASPDIDHGRAKREELHAAARRHRGQDTAALPLVFPGFGPHLAATRKEAVDKQQARLAALDIEAGRKSLAINFGGIRLDDLELDQRIPAERLPDTSQLQRRQSRPALFRALAERGATLREIIIAHLNNNGHHQFTGTYDETANELIRWHEAGAADGFVLAFLDGTAGAREFVEHVVPRLVDRGAFRSTYESDTLRGHLGLAQPQ